MVVISSAVKKSNKELLAAKNKKLPIFKRGEMLANIVALKKNIVVAGSHGKTTTTSLVANILVEAGLDPTVINGGVINSLKNNAQLGKGEWAVIESDESDGSFLKLPITYSIVTNLDKEHLDFYGGFENLKKSFCAFIEKTPSFGKSLICIDDNNLKSLLAKCKTRNFLTYGFDKHSNYQITNLRKNRNFSTFDLKLDINLLKFKNILNSKFIKNNKFLSQLIPFNKKINGNIIINADKIVSSSNIINSGNANLEFRNSVLMVKEFKLIINKIGNIKLEGKIFQQKKKKVFIFNTKINLDNPEIFYSRFLIPKKNRIDLVPINLLGKIDLESYEIKLDKIYLENALNQEELDEDKLFFLQERINEIFSQNSLNNILKYSNLRKIIQSFFN